MTEPVSAYLEGRISAQVALAQLALSGRSADDSARLLADRIGTEELRRLLAAQRANFDRLVMMADACGIDHEAEGPDALPALRAGFDRAAAISPEASVAAYSLGDPALLDAATAELVAWLRRRDLLQARFDVLDLGCGIGRVAAAIAPAVRSVLGLDIACRMVEHARRRCAGLANVRFQTTDGLGIALDAASLDLIIAVDTMPYLVQAGVADGHVADAARALRPGGALAVFNLAYGDDSRERSLAARWCTTCGFALTCAGEHPFNLWDGSALLFQK